MAKKQLQKIFRAATVDRIRSELRAGDSLQGYFKSDFPTQEKDLWQSTIEVSDNPPVLKMPKDDIVSADLENAITLHNYYRSIDETQASDPRFWAYLSHVQFRSYTLARWGLPDKFKAITDPAEIKKAVNQILDHWFVSGNDRDLRRHAIARLWWAAHLTYAPWENELEFFSDFKKEDPYYYTRVMLSTQDIYQQVLERSMCRSQKILISVLDYLDKNKEFASSRENIRDLMKELNLVYGTKKIITLDKADISQLITSIADEIMIGEKN
jgi:hypothetical protein